MNIAFMCAYMMWTVKERQTNRM